MVTTTKKAERKLRNAAVVRRDLIDLGQNRLREVTTAALEAAEKVLVAAQQRVHKLRANVRKPRA